MQGTARIDGIDVKEIGLKDQTAIISAPRDYSGVSVGRTSYRRPGATDQEIEAAAKTANAHEFILELPMVTIL